MTNQADFTRTAAALVAENDEPDVDLETLRKLVEVTTQRPPTEFS
jgi:hypothetical protein